jgi:hypothetical protein
VTIVYTQDYRISGLCPLSGILKNTTFSETGSVSENALFYNAEQWTECKNPAIHRVLKLLLAYGQSTLRGVTAPKLIHDHTFFSSKHLAVKTRLAASECSGDENISDGN